MVLVLALYQSKSDFAYYFPFDFHLNDILFGSENSKYKLILINLRRKHVMLVPYIIDSNNAFSMYQTRY